MIWKSKTRRFNDSLSLDIRSDDGRALVQIDISEIDESDKSLLFRLIQSARKGRKISFMVDSPNPGVQVMMFKFGEES